MRSRLEAAWAEQFDAFGWPWEYEPQVFASELGQYLPDFRVQIGKDDYDDWPVYVEVKPHTYNRDGATRLLSILRASKANAELWLALGADENAETAIAQVWLDEDRWIWMGEDHVGADDEGWIWMDDNALFSSPQWCSDCLVRGRIDYWDGPGDHVGGCLERAPGDTRDWPIMVDEIPVASLYAVRFKGS